MRRDFSLIWLGFTVEEGEAIFGSQFFMKGEGERQKRRREKEKRKRNKRRRRKSRFGTIWNLYVMFGTLILELP